MAVPNNCGKDTEKVVDFLMKEVKDIAKIEVKVNALLNKLADLKSLKSSNDWKITYQKISDIELTAKKIIDLLSPLTALPVGIDDIYILLHADCDHAKEELMKTKSKIDTTILDRIELDLGNFMSRVKGFEKNLEETEKQATRLKFNALGENHRLKREILELKIENEKLRRKLERLEAV